MNQDALEPLEEINDHADMVAALVEHFTSDGKAPNVVSARTSGEQHHDIDGAALRVKSGRKGLGDSNTAKFMLLARYRRPRIQVLPRFEHRSPRIRELEIRYFALEHLGHNLPVLVVIREVMYDPDGVAAGVSSLFISVIWLQPLDFLEGLVADPLNRSCFFAGFAVDSDTPLVGLPRVVDRELLYSKYDPVRGRELRRYVVQCTPEIVYDITNEDPEMVLSKIAESDVEINPTCLWVNLRGPDAVRIVLMQYPADLFLEGFKVMPCAGYLGPRTGEIETHVAAHGLVLKDDAQEEGQAAQNPSSVIRLKPLD